MMQSYSVLAASSVVAIKEKEIVTIKLDEGHEVITLNKGEDFFHPQISEHKKWVAYQDMKSNLYLSNLSDNYDILFQIEDVQSYTLTNDQLIFSKTSGGIFLYDIRKKQVITLIEPSKFIYDQLLINDGGLLFAQKYPLSESKPLGLFEFDLNKNKESLIVDYIPISQQSFGMNPKPAKLSSNGKILYVWCEPSTASASMDGGPLGVYDVNKKKFKVLDQTTMLSYLDNLAINSGTNDVVAIINGGWRFMNENKHLQLLNIESGSLEGVTEDNIASMTPSFSQDGTKLFYSAGLEVKGTYIGFGLGHNHIYQYDLKTKETKQLTNEEKSFDFYPQEIENDELLFLRFNQDQSLCLVRRKTTGEETVLLSNLLTRNFEVYGHLESEQVVAIRY